ncbi:adenosylcobinamide-phosphate synthase CbiB [Nibricoccus sp. IMCC34717]|uniref:adenosylcobinamide-phosphate synthase CbiB n=1 Tax=Nibricoccus sp. IMCC34717 TaxID=3034021 RepID=UPI00384F4630
MNALTQVWEAYTAGFAEPVFLAWLLGAVALDLAIGDPVFRLHPIRLLGDWLRVIENVLFEVGLRGYVGGVLLVVLLLLTTCALVLALGAAALSVHVYLFHGYTVLVLWAVFALRDLLRHGRVVRRAVESGDVAGARAGVAMLVGRDTDRMDAKACGRATIESLTENLVDGVLSPLVFAVLLGPLGAVAYKVASTLDSMVGYKSERYLRFGWAGARLDDVLNFPIARLSYLAIAAAAGLLPGLSAGGALRIGRREHHWLPGPNSGWPEATAAGALQRRLVGPIYKGGVLVNERWIGDPAAPEGGSADDLRRTEWLILLTTALVLGVCAVIPFLKS